MEINFDKVICLDLMKYNDDTINEFAEYFGIHGETLCTNKKKGVKKYYIYTELMDENGTDPVIAYELKPGSPFEKSYFTYDNLKLNATLSRRQIQKLKNLKPFDFISYRKKKNIELQEQNRPIKIEQQNVSITENLDLDTILDKISKLGVSSLSKQEKDFLDGLSK